MSKREISWKEKKELEDRTIEALILGFRKKIHYDYMFPDSYKLAASIAHAVRILCGHDGSYVNNGTCIGWSHLKHAEKLKKRVRKGIDFALGRADRESNSSLDLYMMLSESKLSSEWFPMHGTLYKFRSGERKKVEEQVRAYWKPEELQNFQALHKFMREYVQKAAEKGEK